MLISDKCNCGRPVRYVSSDGLWRSCNKYAVCESYDDLVKIIEDSKKHIKALLEAGAGIAMWREGTSHHKEAIAQYNTVSQVYDKPPIDLYKYNRRVIKALQHQMKGFPQLRELANYAANLKVRRQP